MEKSKVQISMKESRSTSNYISNGPEDEFGVKLTFKAPYDQILDLIK